jgi:two-component system, cell cycle sensor histidine kinase and response regulator CckA
MSALATSHGLLSPLRILLVEDSPIEAHLIRSILQSTSFRVTSVERLSDAVAVLRSSDIDVVLLDLNLPDSQGPDTLDAVLEHAGSIAIVVLTGNGDEQSALDAVAMGAQDYLVKGTANGDTIVRSIRYAFERVRAEEDRRRSQERFRALVENSSDGIALIDAAGNVHYSSPAIGRILGYSIDEIIGMNVFALMHPDDVMEGRRRFVTILNNQAALVAMPDLRYRHSDGTWRYLEVLRMNRLDDPAVRAIVVNFRDVTDRNSALETAERLRRRYELILNSIADGVEELNANGMVSFENAAAASMLRWEPHDLIGRNAHQTIHHSYADGSPRPEEDCPIIATLRDGVVRHVSDDIFWRKDGTCFSVEYEVAPKIDSKGEMLGVVVAFRDVTEQREMQRQVDQAIRVTSLGRVAASVAHEFNNVLMAIQPFTEILQPYLENEPNGMKALRYIRDAVKRGRTISHQILRFANPAEPRLTTLDAGEWMRTFSEEARALLREHRIEIGPAESLVVKADVEQLSQVMLNLAGNARDASPEGSAIALGAVRADAVPFLRDRVPDAHRFAAMFVRDRGSGIAAEVLTHIFEPLFTTKRNGGTGLGLAVVQQIISEHGGEVIVDTLAGAGSTFYVVLPLEEDEYEPPVGGGENSTM